jgi:hypothetical protein
MPGALLCPAVVQHAPLTFRHAPRAVPTQGVDHWYHKTQRAADKNFDKFELYTLKNIFTVPDNLQMVCACLLARSPSECTLLIRRPDAQPTVTDHARARVECSRQAPPPATAAGEDEQLNAELDTLSNQLQRALATKRELKRKLATAEQMTALWEANRENVQQLAASQQSNGVWTCPLLLLTC